jgi:hypothetical protein
MSDQSLIFFGQIQEVDTGFFGRQGTRTTTFGGFPVIGYNQKSRTRMSFFIIRDQSYALTMKFDPAVPEGIGKVIWVGHYGRFIFLYI